MIFDNDDAAENDDPWRKSFKDRLLLGLPEEVWKKVEQYVAEHGPFTIDTTPTPRQRWAQRLMKRMGEKVATDRTALAIEVLTKEQEA